MTITDMTRMCHAHFRSRGFFPEPSTDAERTLQEATQIALVASEAMEALEGHRAGDMKNVAEELADTVIRVFSLCGHLGIDLEAEIIAKMEINRTRPVKHGKRY